ncbi:Uncharacterized protein HZ326_21890 [Fusarium oxysporum f. sp. albedinis]|nr:Uncharacterized protein HZ326_22351 [Fusarium oxysporum f. sp. albedinis]KAJ0135081.1 Uncharacterized protein HZ326_21890 [Fusarium oxysporum f. sp. albedinis]
MALGPPCLQIKFLYKPGKSCRVGMHIMAGFNNLPSELRLLIWNLSLPRRALTLDVLLESESHNWDAGLPIKALVYFERSRQPEVFNAQQQQVERINSICTDSRSVVLWRYVNQIQLYDRTQPGAQRSKWIRCNLKQDTFIAGQFSSTLRQKLGHYTIPQGSLGSMTMDLVQQLQCIRTLVIDQNQQETDIIGMVRADGDTLGRITPELVGCIHVMKNLRVLVVTEGCCNMLRITKAKALSVAARRAIIAEKVRQGLDLRHNHGLFIVCLNR